MIDLFPADRIPVELQPLATLLLGWIVSLYALAAVPPSKHRRLVTSLASTAFGAYWLLFAAGVDLQGFSPYFGADGLGYELFFAAMVLAVHHSFWVVENRQNAPPQPTQAARPQITFLESEPPPLLLRPLTETAIRVEPESPVA